MQIPFFYFTSSPRNYSVPQNGSQPVVARPPINRPSVTFTFAEGVPVLKPLSADSQTNLTKGNTVNPVKAESHPVQKETPVSSIKPEANVPVKKETPVVFIKLETILPIKKEIPAPSVKSEVHVPAKSEGLFPLKFDVPKQSENPVRLPAMSDFNHNQSTDNVRVTIKSDGMRSSEFTATKENRLPNIPASNQNKMQAPVNRVPTNTTSQHTQPKPVTDLRAILDQKRAEKITTTSRPVSNHNYRPTATITACPKSKIQDRLKIRRDTNVISELAEYASRKGWPEPEYLVIKMLLTDRLQCQVKVRVQL